MATRGRPLGNSYRKKSPCAGCTERFTACHGKCPIDERGEYGYAAWNRENAEIAQKRKAYNDDMRNYKNRRIV